MQVSVHGDALTVSGRTLAEEAATASEAPGQIVVRPLADPLSPTGRLVILRGNLAPEGCVVKVSGDRHTAHRGPARVFDSEEDAFDAVQQARIAAGDVVVIRYEGPRGGPGMREMLGGHCGHRRSGVGRIYRARHRWTVLRRDARPDGRTRCPGGCCRRTDRRGSRRGCRHHRYGGAFSSGRS